MGQLNVQNTTNVFMF